MSKKVFVAQPYQEGTSFSEIRRGIEKSCMKVSHEINILDYPYSFDEKEEGVFDDYREIFLHVQVIRDLLKERELRAEEIFKRYPKEELKPSSLQDYQNEDLLAISFSNIKPAYEKIRQASEKTI